MPHKPFENGGLEVRAQTYFAQTDSENVLAAFHLHCNVALMSSAIC